MTAPKGDLQAGGTLQAHPEHAVRRSDGRTLRNWIFVTVLMLTGCAPSLSVTPFIPTGPTIAQLQNHLTCVVMDAMDKHLGPAAVAAGNNDDFDLWYNLVRYNFFDAVNLTLFVTQSEGLNPSFNFITPLTNLGGSTPLTKTTTNTFNSTIAVGLQLDGMQDRNFVLNYTIDLHKLYNDTYASSTEAGSRADRDPHHIKYNPSPSGLHSLCDNAASKENTAGLSYGLMGDLAVHETLESGLRSLQAIRAYPDSSAGNGGSSKSSQQSPSAAPSQAAGTTTGFSAKLDFNLLWGINGGPNWTLVNFKGPGGGSSGGSGSGGGSGGGSSGGGGGQLVNYSRTKQDTLISTFSATCKSDEDVDLLNAPNAKLKMTSSSPSAEKGLDGKPIIEPLKIQAAWDSAAFGRTKETRYNIELTVSANVLKTADGAVSDSTGSLILYAATGPAYEGYISWSGFHHPNSYSLTGTISDVHSKTALGLVYLNLVADAVGKLSVQQLKFSRNALELLTQEASPAPGDYWSLLPSCTVAAPFLPNGLNLLQQLPSNVGSTILQQ